LPEPRSLIEGKYEILDTIQESETTAIYKVRHLHLDEVRVIKVMHTQRGASDEQARRFLQEAKTLTLLKHPNVCSILDFFQDAEGTTYIVLEFIDGVNMSELLKLSGLPSLPLALEIAHQTLLALGCLHRRNIIHRDIAPDNIMLTMDEEHEPHVKLIGLGVAKMLGGTVELTSSGEFVGKMKYSSPEQLGALDEGEKLDGRSDLYSLGVVLYETLTGALPIRGEQPREILVGHLFLPPIPFFKSDPEGKVPQEVSEIVLKALEKRREKRFSSAEEFDEQVVSLKNRFATLEQSEITRPLTIGEAWRTPFKSSVRAVSAALERSNPESSPRTTQAVVPQPPVPAPTPPVPDDLTLAVKQPAPIPTPIVESPAETPTIPPPPPVWRRRRLPPVPGVAVAAGIVVAVLLLFLLRRSKPELRPQAAVPAPTAVVVTAESTPPVVTVSSTTRSTAPPAPSEPSHSTAASPAPASDSSMPTAEEARSRVSAARSAAEKEEAPARAPNTYRRGRQKETEAQTLFERQEYSFAETAFAAAEQLFRKAQESSAQGKRETQSAKRRLSSPNLTPIGPVLAAAPAQAEPARMPTAPPIALQAPVLLREVRPNYPMLDTLLPGPDEIVIVVEAVVTERGDVRDAKVPKVQYLVLDRPAIYAVSNWHFRPAMLNGNPVAVRLRVTSVVRRLQGFQGNRLREVSRKAETIGLATPAP